MLHTIENLVMSHAQGFRPGYFDKPFRACCKRAGVIC